MKGDATSLKFTAGFLMQGGNDEPEMQQKCQNHSTNDDTSV